MRIERTALDGVLIVTPSRFHDTRGFFTESWSDAALRAAGLRLDFVQDNQSFSKTEGTMRGLHYQAPPAAQDKLIRVVSGRIFDVAVDARRGSATFGAWAGVELCAESGRQLLVPKGFLHGFVTRSPNTHVLYKTTAPYCAAADGAVHFADPNLAIDWGIGASQVTVSGKDKAAPNWCDWHTPFEDGHLLEACA